MAIRNGIAFPIPVRHADGGPMKGLRTRLDVRSVEPRQRFDAIMNAFEEVPAGGALDLTVDHDPLGVYYTLKVMRGSDAISFHYLEEGPEVWRVSVGRLA